MNSSEPLAKEMGRPSVPARLASNWVELFAVPIASAIMEAQPILLFLYLITPRLLDTSDQSPSDALAQVPDALTLILLMIGLQWWCMWLHATAERRGWGRGTQQLYSLLGAVLALILVGLTHLTPIENGSTFTILAIILTTWFWYRGQLRARDSLGDSYLTNAFRIGFFVLLGVMVFAVLSSLGGGDLSLISLLARDLPIFFLSGLIALSFTRIGVIQKEQKSHPGSGTRGGTQSWIAGLTITWIVLVVASVALESLPLNTLMTILSPIWFVLGLLATAVLYLLGLIVTGFMYIIGAIAAGFLFLIGLFLHQSTKKPDIAHQAQQAAHPLQHATKSTQTVTIIIIALLLIVLAIVVTTIVLKSRKDAGDEDASEEEVRETLDRNAVRQQRRDERRRQRKEGITLEALDPASIRARYRDFLQALAEKEDDLRYRPSETPAEYQTRLLTVARKRGLLKQDEPDADPAILARLTDAYIQERYGGRQVDSTQQDYLRDRVPQLTQKLTSNVPATTAKPATRWSADKARWGED